MTDASMPASFAPSDFRVGNVLSRTTSLLSRHLLVFIVITIVANLPLVLLLQGVISLAATVGAGGDVSGAAVTMVAVGFVLYIVLSILSQAVIVHAAFQAMRARPINLGESLRVGLACFIPVFLLGLIMGILIVLASMALIVPGVILMTMWFVGMPACVVERLGPWTSLRRSAALTKGNRWRILGLFVLLFIISAFVSNMVELALAPVGSIILTMLGSLAWYALWGAYYAIAVVVAYHDLRVAKEGIDIEQIAAVFD